MLAVAHELAVDLDAAFVDRLEMVDAADQGRLARARRPDQAQRLPGVDVEVDAAQDVDLAEALVHALQHDARHLLAHRALQRLTGPRAELRRSAKPGAWTRSPTASLRSMIDWTIDQTEVRTRYQNATAVKYSTGLKEDE